MTKSYKTETSAYNGIISDSRQIFCQESCAFGLVANLQPLSKVFSKRFQEVCYSSQMLIDSLAETSRLITDHTSCSHNMENFEKNKYNG